MSARLPRLDRRRSRALEALLVAPTVAAASRASGISVRVFWRYLSEPDFARSLRDARSRALQQAATRLASGAGDAAQRLCDLLDSDDQGVALGAARALVTLSIKAAETGDVLDRLDALEERYANPPSVSFRAVPSRRSAG
jgi:hypothetical protein